MIFDEITFKKSFWWRLRWLEISVINPCQWSRDKVIHDYKGEVWRAGRMSRQLWTGLSHLRKLDYYSKLAMAPHSNTLAWQIPWTEEPGGLPSMGSWRVRHDWATSLSRFTFMHWRRKWPPTPVFLPGESQGRRSLVGCCLWGHTESDTTEVT